MWGGISLFYSICGLITDIIFLTRGVKAGPSSLLGLMEALCSSRVMEYEILLDD